MRTNFSGDIEQSRDILKGSHPRILVCDDEEDIRQLIRQMLERQGFEAAEAKNGSQALEMLQSQTFELLLLDFQMPNMSGLELLEAIRPVRPSLKVIMISGTADGALRRQALALGAVECLCKPFDLGTLTSIVMSTLGGQVGECRANGGRGGTNEETTGTEWGAKRKREGRDE